MYVGDKTVSETTYLNHSATKDEPILDCWAKHIFPSNVKPSDLCTRWVSFPQDYNMGDKATLYGIRICILSLVASASMYIYYDATAGSRDLSGSAEWPEYMYVATTLLMIGMCLPILAAFIFVGIPCLFHDCF